MARIREFYAIPETLVIPFTKAEKLTFEGKPMVRRSLVIENHLIRLDAEKEEDKIYLDLLDNAKGNTKNGGTSFFEVDARMREQNSLSRNESFAFEPKDGVTEDDKQAIEYLNGLGASLPPNTIKKALPIAQALYDRFNIKNVARPKEGMRPKVLRAVFTSMVDAIEEAGLWNGNSDSEGQTDSGAGAEEDQG